MRVSLDTGIPVIFGILTTEDHAQALERASVESGDKGGDCAEAAIEMAQIARDSF
jgi:6,7-dimethyl-8-ribityllumazine synthase